MPGAGGYARAKAGVLETCRSAGDERTLRRQIVEELRHVVGFDSYAWLLTDPATSVGASPLAEVAWLQDLARQIELKYRTTVNRWTALQDTAVALLDQTTGGDLAQSLVWRELLIRYGVLDAASWSSRTDSAAGLSSSFGGPAQRCPSPPPRRPSSLKSQNRSRWRCDAA